jgi:predicted GIY-YIG superfamily endonuclease
VGRRKADEATVRLHGRKQASRDALHGRYIQPATARVRASRGVGEGRFSAKYGCKVLVWYELHETMIEAITREKQIKAGSRAKKLALIEALNPEWKDLYDSLI